MKKLIHVLTDKNIGGAGRWLLSTLRCTDREKYEVKVLLPEDSLLRERVEELGVEVLTVAGMAERSWDKASLRGMTALFRAERPDIVHVGASLTARIAARRAGVPALVMTKHCAAQPCGAVGRMAHRALDRALTDAVIAVSHSVAQGLVCAGTPRERVVTICNGITPAAPDAARQELLRGRYGLDKEHIWVGVAARLESVKGVDLFLDAARQAARENDSLRFAIFGIGSQEQMLREKAKDLGEKVRFLGFSDEIEQALALLDICVVSSRSEAICLTAIEALSMGTPVAAFDIDGVSEVVRDGETGLLAPPQDTAALAKAILRLAGDTTLRRTLGERGSAVVRGEFTAQAMVRRQEALYEEILARKGLADTSAHEAERKEGAEQ